MKLTGCLGSLALVAIVVGLIAFHFRGLTEPYAQALREATNALPVREELGTPVRFEPMKAQVTRNAEGQICEVSIPLNGPNGTAICHFKINTVSSTDPKGKPAAKNVATDITVTFQKTGHTISIDDGLHSHP